SACVHNCEGHCILKAHVRDGVIVRITSDVDGPDTPYRRQLRACARGRAYRQRVYHPDRLKFPLIREGERGEGQFRRASWDEALDRAAEGIRRVRERYGNEAMFVHYGTGHKGLLRGNALAQRLQGLYGGFLNYHNDYSVACTRQATLATYGTTETGNSFDDLVNSRLIILWAANLAETFTGTGAPWYVRQARRRGARVVYVDPIYTDTAAALADEWIPIYPGTDNAMMDAMAYVMITEGLHDQSFLDTHCVGFDEEHLPLGAAAGSSYRSHVLGLGDGTPKTPAWAERITGVPAETIGRLAREYATARPTALLQGWGVQRTAFGEQATRGAIVLAAMTGNVGVSGGGAAGQGACGRQLRLAKVPVPNPVKASIPIFLWTDAIVRGTEMGVADGVRGVERLSSNVKLILNFQSNVLANQHADVNRTARLLRDPNLVEFILVADQFLTPSARFADVVFPAVTWFEREDVASGEAWGEYALFLNQAIEPLGEARSDYWALSRLAERLGVGEAFTEGRDEEGWLRHLVARSGIPDYDEFKRTGVYRRVAEEPYVAFADFRRDPLGHPLATPSGKIEIYSHVAAGFGDPERIPAVPKYIPAPEGREDPLRADYPLQLLTPHPRHRTHSIFGNVPWLQEISVEAAHLNPADAGPRGVTEGDKVRVWNERGAVVLPAHLTERVRPGVVVIYQGKWYAPGADGVDTGRCANVLTSQRATAWAKGNAQHTSLVQVAKEEEGG
ncbi:MAG: DMSO/selenate family reductase complex A subunit, partial [Chloroflexota bacterium]